jgi:branched-chain amino acid transport system permease protein
MLYWQLALAGIASGSIAALSGLGLVLTYRATGIFNFAHGAVAVFVAYILWQSSVGWGWPVALSAILAIVIVGPLIGIVLERFVFRPLEVRRASTSEKLVATLGVFVVLVGLCQTIWGGGSKTDTPNLFPQTEVSFSSDLSMGANQLAEFVIVIVAAAALLAMFRFTHLGTRIRAVVDRRQLADLTGVNANRVAAIAWALGCGFAGLTGALLAPQIQLDPFRLTLLVIDTFGVAVVARLTSLPLAVLSGIVLGVAQSEMTSWSPPAPWDSLRPNLLGIALIVALLIYRTLNERDEDAHAGRGLVASGVGRERSLPARLRFLIPAALVATLVPFGLSGNDLSNADEILCLAVVLVSITAVTGFTGNITLGQAGFAGLGALASIHLHNSGLWFLPKMPVILAMLVSSILAGLVGALVGFSALRRRGLFLGLTTLAVGLIIDRFMFENPYFLSHLDISRPNLFGLSLNSDRAFYWFSLACLGVVFIGVDRMRRGRLGRKLAAMRDSETGARSIGLDLRAYKLLVFSASAAIAGFGGALLAQQTRGFSTTAIGPVAFDPFHSLFWFTAVIVAGASYLSGSVVAAVLFVAFDQILGSGGSTLVIGVLALFMSRFPRGIVGTFMEAVQGGAAPQWLRRAYDATHRPPSEVFPAEPALRPTEFATKVLQEVAK